EELARVRAERLDVAPLALGIEGVEDERGLPGAGHARDDHELARRDGDADALQVVLAGAADEDGVAGDLFLLQAAYSSSAHHLGPPVCGSAPLTGAFGPICPDRAFDRRAQEV